MSRDRFNAGGGGRGRGRVEERQEESRDRGRVEPDEHGDVQFVELGDRKLQLTCLTRLQLVFNFFNEIMMSPLVCRTVTNTLNEGCKKRQRVDAPDRRS
jgi:hypothetical protein